MSIKEQKKQLRIKHKGIRLGFKEAEKKSLDNSLAKQFLSLEEYKDCETLFAFVSSPIEVDTIGIINHAFADGKKVAVPKCSNLSGDMDFYYIASLSELKEGAYGILEPDSESTTPAISTDKDLCLVPGLSFDPKGYRLGFGKGYYDRFLADFKGTTAGLCYTANLEKELPIDEYDIPVDIVITDKSIVRER